MYAAQVSVLLQQGVHPPTQQDDCPWWNLVCQGGHQVADSSLTALTQSMIHGLTALFGQITKIVDESTRVPLADPGYRDTYYGFAQLAVPVIGVVFLIALIAAALRRDPRALTRATVGVAVAGIGGLVYVLFAQVLVGLDDWLAHGIVAITGADFGEQMTRMVDKFALMGSASELSADFLMLILMLAALVAGVCLWVVLLLRKMAILVVVAFAPILIAGWLWAPTRSWSRKATEVLIALVFSKTVIYMIFGIGMSMLLRDHQSLSDFVGVLVLLCGACFAPLVMLKLVHFATDSHLAADMVGNLRAGAQPAINRVSRAHSGQAHRQQMARDYASSKKHAGSAHGGEAVVPKPGPEGGGNAGAAASKASAGSTAGGAGGSAGAAGGAGGSASGAAGASAAAGPAAVGAAGVAVAAETAKKAKEAGVRGSEAMSGMGDAPPPSSPGPSDSGTNGENT
jgi:hypothetical protein